MVRIAPAAVRERPAPLVGAKLRLEPRPPVAAEIPRAPAQAPRPTDRHLGRNHPREQRAERDEHDDAEERDDHRVGAAGASGMPRGYPGAECDTSTGGE